jgi:chromate reductase, NAD(P)H dehydrogenase (quinone)
MRILTISGSLRSISSNANVLEAVAMLAPPGVTIIRYRGLDALPHFNPDLDKAEAAELLPQAVQDLRREIGRCDALMISSPEYAHGVAGALKNALDWLVGSGEFPGKPVALVNTAPRAVHADAQLREILKTMAARLVEDASVTLPIAGVGRQFDTYEIATDPELSRQLRQALEALVLQARP